MNENVSKHLQVLLDMAMKVLPYVVNILAVIVAVVAAVGVYSLLPFWELYAYGYITDFWMSIYIFIFVGGILFIFMATDDGSVGVPILGLHVLCGALLLGFFLSSVQIDPTDSAFFRTEKGLVSVSEDTSQALFLPAWKKGQLAIAHDTSGSMDYPVSLPAPANGKLANLKITVDYTWSQDAVKADLSTHRQVDYHQQVGGAVEAVLAKFLKDRPDAIDAGTLKALAGAISVTACQQAGGAGCPVQLKVNITYVGGNTQISFKQDAGGANTNIQN